MDDVVVVGAGPTGCAVAGELARAGRSVTILDRHAAPSPVSRAFGVHARTLELLDSRGLADELIATGTPVDRLQLVGEAGIDLGRLPTRFPFVLMTPQVHVDRLLERHAVDAGARVERGVTVTGLEQDADGVVVRAGERSWRARWVVGADGVHSTVRELVGLPFPGRSVLRSVVLADVALPGLQVDELRVDVDRHGFGFLAPFGDGWFRLIGWDRRRQVGTEVPVAEYEVAGLLHRVLGLPPGEVRWSSRFASDERQVPTYRSGRVFLAGDAAHVHSPAGGQGMNTGIQDGVALGWRLAAVSGGVDPALLDGYQAERHPVGRAVLRASGAVIRLMTLAGVRGRVARALVLRGLLRLPPVARRGAGQFSAVAIRYPGPGLVGTRAAQVPLAGARLAEVQRTAGCVLVLPRGAADVAATVPVVRRTDDGPGLLVRPDGYIAWVGDPGTGDWRSALDRLEVSRPGT